MRTLFLIPLLILGLSLSAVPGIAGGGTKAGEPTFAELLALAERDMGTKKGAAYDTLIGKQFSEKHAKSVGACVEAAGSAMPEPLKVVLVIAKDGKVTSISLSRQDEVAKCIGSLVLQEVFPKPPVAPFHDLMQMSFE